MSTLARFAGPVRKKEFSWWVKSTIIIVPITVTPIGLLNTYCLDKYQDFFSYYQHGKPVEVPEDLNATFDEVKNNLTMHPYFKKFINVFMASGFDPFRAGTTKSLTGAIVGLPRCFTYKSVEEAKKEAKEIRIQGGPVQWEYVDPEVSNKFFNSLVFSEKAKKYAIANYCFLTDNHGFFLNMVTPVFIFGLNGIVGDNISQRLTQMKVPALYRAGIYIFVWMGAIASWLSLDKIQEHALQTEANGRILLMGKDYLEGAVEYWSKMIDRNIALRALMYDGESRYSVKGKELSLLLGYRGIPPVNQKHYFEEKLELLRKHKEEEANAQK